MDLNFTKKQYQDLLGMINVANSVVGILKDHTDDKKYDDLCNRWESLENYIGESAKDFDCGEMFEKFDGKNILKEKVYDKYFAIIEAYDELTTHMFISNKLAWRDFHETYTREAIDNMAKNNGGYFGVELHSFEEKYWDEINENDYKCFRIVED